MIIWIVRIIWALVIGTGFYEMVHAESLGTYLGYSAFLMGWGIIGILWVRHLERIRDTQTRHRDTFAP